jgi:hypothetical protein
VVAKGVRREVWSIKETEGTATDCISTGLIVGTKDRCSEIGNCSVRRERSKGEGSVWEDSWPTGEARAEIKTGDLEAKEIFSGVDLASRHTGISGTRELLIWGGEEGSKLSHRRGIEKI